MTFTVTGIFPWLAFSSTITRRSIVLDSPGSNSIPEVPMLTPLGFEKK